MKQPLVAVAAASAIFLSSFGVLAAEDIPSSSVDTTITLDGTLSDDITEDNNAKKDFSDSEIASDGTDIIGANEDSTKPETGNTITDVPKNISFDIEFTGGADRVTIDDTLWTEVTFHNYGDNFTATARWLLNGQPIEGFTNENFSVYNGKTSAYPKLITDDFWGWGDISVGFEILINGESFYKAERRVQICNVPYPQEKIDEVFAKVQPVKVEAWLNKNATLYTSVSCSAKKGTVSAGTKVTCLASKTNFSNYIKLPNGSTGWVRVQDLNVSSKNYTQKTDLSNWEKNIFVNAKGYSSDTEYLVWVNLAHQKVNVFKGKRGKWSIEGSFSCATGENRTPTVTGEFKYYARDSKWTYPGYYVGPCLIFSGNYALHSVLLSDKGGVYDGTLGRPASHGCVRLAKHHIDWLDENLPLGSTVVVY